MIHFFVPGEPGTQGSKKSFQHAKTKKIVTIDSCKRNKPWRDTVAAFALGHAPAKPLTGPIVMVLTFFMKRPKSHYRANGELKPNAPKVHTKRPDRTKLTRPVEDAMTGLIYADDSQIVGGDVRKVYTDGRVGVEIEISEMSD